MSYSRLNSELQEQINLIKDEVHKEKEASLKALDEERSISGQIQAKLDTTESE